MEPGRCARAPSTASSEFEGAQPHSCAANVRVRVSDLTQVLCHVVGFVLGYGAFVGDDREEDKA